MYFIRLYQTIKQTKQRKMKVKARFSGDSTVIFYIFVIFLVCAVNQIKMYAVAQNAIYLICCFMYYFLCVYGDKIASLDIVAFMH